MRFIIFGIGAIGGTLAVRLLASGHPVLGIARGAMLSAIRSSGLLLETPRGPERAMLDCVAQPSEIDYLEDDCVLLCMKTQDTAGALLALRRAGVTGQSIVCFQNGVENERLALRFFPNVYAVCANLPASFLNPGAVQAYGDPHPGVIDVGRFPTGVDSHTRALTQALRQAGFICRERDDPMAAKYAKLLFNLGNVLQAVGDDRKDSVCLEAMQEEARQVYAASGIRFDSPEHPRGVGAKAKPIGSTVRGGGSTWQSIARGSGSIETDYLNGEICLLGRQTGIPTPVNDHFVRLASLLVQTGEKA